MKIIRAAAFAIAIAATGAPAFAHHNANAQWQTDKTVQMTGVLKEIRDIQPHAQWTVEIKNAQGKVEEWHLEAIQNAALRRQGVKVKTELVPGQTYTYILAPSRDGTKTAFLKGIVINGKKIDIVRL